MSAPSSGPSGSSRQSSDDIPTCKSAYCCKCAKFCQDKFKACEKDLADTRTQLKACQEDLHNTRRGLGESSSRLNALNTQYEALECKYKELLGQQAKRARTNANALPGYTHVPIERLAELEACYASFEQVQELLQKMRELLQNADVGTKRPRLDGGGY